MNERFKNLNYRPDTTLGIVLLSMTCLVMLLANRFAYPLLGTPTSEFERHLSYSLSGVVIAEFALLAIWVVLSNHSLMRRFQFLFCASTALLAAWLLGYLDSFSEVVGFNWAHDQLIYYLGILPLLFLATSLPLIGLRLFFSRVLAPLHGPQPPVRRPLTTAGLMVTTAIIAFVLATAQLPMLVEADSGDTWGAIGIFAGLTFMISLVVVLPNVLVLCSSRRSFLPWSVVALGVSLPLTAGIIVTLSSLTWAGYPLSKDELLVLVQVVVSGMMVFLLGIASMRSFGYRLMKAEWSGRKK